MYVNIKIDIVLVLFLCYNTTCDKKYHKFTNHGGNNFE